MVWYLRDAQVRDLVSSDEANQVMEEVFQNAAREQVVTRPTVELPLPRGQLRVKVGADFANGVYGFKAYQGGRYLILCYDVETGLDAMVEARRLTELRTGAVSAVGTKFMARKDASTLAIIGTGREARQQLGSVLRVRDFIKVWCYSRSADNREEFARGMTRLHDIEVIPVVSAEECVRDADVVTTITSSSEPVLFGSWLREGTHINGVGATTPGKRELDQEAIARCGTIVVESKEGAIDEIGELIYAVQHGVLNWHEVQEMKDVVSGLVKGRKSDDEITLFDTVGIGAEDVALGWFAVKKARELGIGTNLDLEQQPAERPR